MAMDGLGAVHAWQAVPADGLRAAPAASPRRHQQQGPPIPATYTATPRIRLTATVPATLTATPRVGLPSTVPATNTAEPGGAGAGPTVTRGGADSGSEPAERPDASAASGTDDSGASDGMGDRDARSPTTALSVPVAGEAGAGDASGPSAADESAEGAASGESPDARAAWPPGPLAPAASEAGIDEMWRIYGSPHQGRSVLQRLTDGRPAPWRWWSYYVALAVLFYLALAAVWRRIAPSGAGNSGAEHERTGPE